jgi:hypothetical protein
VSVPVPPAAPKEVLLAVSDTPHLSASGVGESTVVEVEPQPLSAVARMRVERTARENEATAMRCCV